MNVLHVMPSFFPAVRYGGPIYSVYSLCQQLASAGCNVCVLTTDADGDRDRLAVNTSSPVRVADRFEITYSRRLWSGSVSIALLFRLIPLVRWADVVHLTAVYSFTTIPVLFACRLFRKPLVWSPRGSFSSWENGSRRGDKVVWNKICRWLLPARTIVHYTSEQEEELSKPLLPGIPSVVIANGIHCPEPLLPRTEESGRFRLLFVGRLNPIKALDRLIQACGRLGNLPWSLTIVGAGESGYLRSLVKLCSDLGLDSRISFLGELTGEEKEAAFSRADVLVLPSHSENFGVAAAEALARGVPVIASKGTPWSDLEKFGCGCWVDNDPATLADAIEKVYSTPRLGLATVAISWMKKEFSWENQSRSMIAAYRSLID